MSHDQKPARVRVVTASGATPAGGSSGGANGGGSGDADGDLVEVASPTGTAAGGGGRGTLLLAGLFIAAAGVGGACAGVFLS